MESTTEESKLLDWLKARPEMYEQLKRIRELEFSDPQIDRAELELFELVKSIGASSFQHILQQKSDVTEQEERERSKVRVPSKKNFVTPVCWDSSRWTKRFYVWEQKRFARSALV